MTAAAVDAVIVVTLNLGVVLVGARNINELSM